MNFEGIKTIILSIIFMGVAITLAGIILFIYRQQIAPYMRFLLPIPPIGVAAYVFVFNLFSRYDGQRPGTVWATLAEISLASVLSFVFFFVFAVILVFAVDATK